MFSFISVEMAILTFALDDSTRRNLIIGLLLELMGYPFKNGLRITGIVSRFSYPTLYMYHFWASYVVSVGLRPYEIDSVGYRYE